MPVKKTKIEDISCIPVDWLKSVPSAFFLLDLKGRIIWCNDTFVELTGYDREGIIGARLDRLFSQENISSMLEDLMVLYKGQRFASHPYDLMRQSGSSIHVSMDMTPILSGATETVTHVFGNIRSHYALE